MIRRLICTATAAGLFAASSAFAATWNIDDKHSYATFKVRHMMVTNVRGTIGGVSGSVALDEKDFSKSSVTAKLDPATINTNDQKRDEHLRSPDFFNVAKHPTISFSSTGVTGAAGSFKLKGNLTMNGVTKEVTLDVTGPSDPVKGMRGETRRGISASTRLNRQDFGISWNKTMDKGGVVVGNEVDVEIDMELILDEKSS